MSVNTNPCARCKGKKIRRDLSTLPTTGKCKKCYEKDEECAPYYESSQFEYPTMQVHPQPVAQAGPRSESGAPPTRGGVPIAPQMGGRFPPHAGYAGAAPTRGQAPAGFQGPGPVPGHARGMSGFIPPSHPSSPWYLPEPNVPTPQSGPAYDGCTCNHTRRCAVCKQAIEAAEYQKRGQKYFP